MAKMNPHKPMIGSTALVQSCARMMSAAWVEQQLAETSTAPMTDVSGIAMALRYTIASDLGMGFELAFKSLVQELPNVEIRGGHDLTKCWEHIPPAIQGELDTEVEQLVSLRFGGELLGKVLPFDDYLERHAAFINRTVDRRYALVKDEGDKSRSVYSEALFVARAGRGLAPINKDILNTLGYVDGIGALAMYWHTIMGKVLELRWPQESQTDGGGPWPEKDQARNLISRAADQLIGPLSVMSEEELKNKQVRQFEHRHPEFGQLPPGVLPIGWARD